MAAVATRHYTKEYDRLDRPAQPTVPVLFRPSAEDELAPELEASLPATHVAEPEAQLLTLADADGEAAATPVKGWPNPNPEAGVFHPEPHHPAVPPGY